MGLRRLTMHIDDSNSWIKLQQRLLSRCNLIRGAAGTALGASLVRPKSAYADNDDGDYEHTRRGLVNPIPGGVPGFAPFGVFSGPLLELQPPRGNLDC
jgi:hypothetical protein